MHAYRMQRSVENNKRIKKFSQLERVGTSTSNNDNDSAEQSRQNSPDIGGKELTSIMSACKLPTMEAVQIASFEKQQPLSIQRLEERYDQAKKRGITLDSVPSHIVPPRPKQLPRQIINLNKLPSSNTVNSSQLASSENVPDERGHYR